jgi:hypothetical protein
MISVTVAVLAILFIEILVHRYRLRERRHERLVLRRIANSYVEPHKNF